MRLSFLFCILLIVSCRGNQKQLDQLSWLEGKWAGKSGTDDVFENWTRTKNGYSGFAGTVSEGDTVFSEKLIITPLNNKIIYQVELNNSGKEVRFESIQIGKRLAIFENKAHDFPQQIIYMLQIDSSLHARVQGNVGGQTKGTDIFYHKVN